MFRGGKVNIIAAAVAAVIISIIGVVVKGSLPEPDPVKIPPAMVTVDTSTLRSDQAQAEIAAVWSLFDRNTETAYTPSQASRITVSLPEQKTISRIRVYGSSSYLLNVYRDNAGTWEPVIGATLQSLGSSWNDLTPSEPFTASLLLIELVPQAGTTSGLREMEVWGNEASGAVAGTVYTTLENILTPEKLLNLLSKSPSHIVEFGAYPSEISVPDGASQQTSGLIHVSFTQNPVLFKRAYLLYDGYNIYRSGSVQRRINNLSWSGGFSIPQPEGTTPAWASFVEEINPAWLTQGENTIEFKTSGGTASVRGLKLVVETDSGWNSVSSISEPALSDGDTTTAYEIRAALVDPSVQINFDRKVQPEKLRLHLPGPANIKAGLRYKTASGWQDVKTGWQMDLSAMQAGWNEITVPSSVTTDSLQIVFYTSSLKAKPGVLVGSVDEVRVAASPAGPASSTESLIISYPRDGEYFGRTAYIQGFAVPSSAGASAANVNIEGKTSTNSDGAFSLSLTKDDTRFYSQADDDEWNPVVKSDYAGRAAASVTMLLNKNSSRVAPTDPNKESRGDAPFSDNREKHTERVSPGQAKKIQYKGVTLDIPQGAVDKDTDITIVPLTEADLAHYNPGLINVTYPDAGYRFLPHGIKFKKAIKISFGYSKTLFAFGQTDNDVNMYYYDESLLRWRQLTRAKVDPAVSQVTSESDHFTDIINSTLVVPEHPQALSFNPNSIKDIKAADPSANIDLIEPPQGTSMGAANLSYPIEIPRGRGAYSPDLKVTYSSGNANGWMGLGWDIPVSKIQADTRWGVPRYDYGALVSGSPKETESYLLDGATLAPYAPRPFATETLEDRSAGDKVFKKRVEGDFQRIIRKNTKPYQNEDGAAYYWEVTDKNGVKYIYGQTTQAQLADYDTGNIFQWNLEKVIDTNGNQTEFEYDIDVPDSGYTGESFRQIYLKKITYTSHLGKSGSKDKNGLYTVEFNRSASRPDVIVDGKPGFQVRTRQRLENVDVKFNAKTIRQYVFTYISDSEASEYHFGKSLIKKITEKGLNGTTEFYSHDFSYEKMPKTSQGGNNYVGFKDEIKEWSGASGGHGLTESEDKMKSVALSLSVAFSTNYPTFGFQGNYGKGESWTNGMFVDVNGDGLPDHLQKDGAVELNYLDANDTERDHGSFTSASFPGIGKLGSNKQNNFSIGGQLGYWIASANFAYSYNFVNTEKMMTDIDGDGFIDQVALSGGMTVYKNTGSKFTSGSWNGFSTSGVDFGNGEAAAKLKGDFFLSDPVRKWIAPYKGDVRIKGAVSKLKKGTVDDPVDSTNPDDTASVLAYIYKNSDQTALWSAKIKAADQTAYSHDVAIPVVPGDQIYFRVNSVDDTDDDEVSWQPEVSYEKLCLTENGVEQCVKPGSSQYLLTDQLGHSLLKFESGKEHQLSGTPDNKWVPGAKGRVRIKGKAVKKKSSDDVSFMITQNGTPLWLNAVSSGEEAEFSHDLTIDVMPGDNNSKYPGDEIRFDVLSSTTVDPETVAWQPEIIYENYCLMKPDTNPTEYICGDVTCQADSDNVVQCRINVDTSVLPEEAKIEEKDIHVYGQPNYPFYYLIPTELSRFWVAPYDGKIRVRGDVVRTVYAQKNKTVTTNSAVAAIKGVNSLLWKQSLSKRSLPPYLGKDDPPHVEDKYSHDVTIAVSQGDQIFFDIQVMNFSDDPAQFDWTPEITYSEYGFTDDSGQKITETLSELRSAETVTEQYCHSFDDNNDGQVDRTVCTSTDCPKDTGPESGQCRYCTTTTNLVTDPTTSQQTTTTQQECQPITCTIDPIEGTKACSPLSFIYEARPANVRYKDPVNYYDELSASQKSSVTPEAFAGGYRSWYYGDWNGNMAWDAARIRRTKEEDVPKDEDSFNGDYKSLPSYYFVYMKPQWQGVSGYENPVWGGRGEKEYISAEQVKSSRVGTNVSAVMNSVSGTGASTIQQSVSKNTAYGISLGVAGVSYSNGDSKNSLDFMDMNGDRFPDQVSSGGVLFNNGVNGFFTRALSPSVGKVRTIDNKNVSYQLSYTLPQNRQNAKGVTVKVTTPGASLGLSYGYSNTDSDLIDINGDGLPDRVSRTGANSYSVSLNLGYRFGAATTWTTDSWGIGSISNDTHESINPDALQINENATYNLAASFWGIGGGAGYTVARGLVALRDINGDGLADQILKRTDDTNDYFYVKLNRGDSFGPVEIWHAPSWGRDVADNNVASSLPGGNDAINYNASLSYHLSGGIVIMIPLIPVITVAWLDIAPTVSISGGKGGAELDFNDINGDGLPDHLLKLKDYSAVYARINNVGRTNLLTEVKRPLGGSFTIEYERKGNTMNMPQSQWVLKATHLSDGMGHTYNTGYAYGDGYQDRFQRDFYGFNRMVETHAPGTGIERTISQDFYTNDFNDYRDYYYKGRLKKSVTTDNTGRVWAKTANNYELKDVLDSKSQTVLNTNFPALSSTIVYFYDGSKYNETDAEKSTSQEFTYDKHGNVTLFVDRADWGAADDLYASITYWNDPYDNYIVGKAKSIAVRSQSESGPSLRSRDASYDNSTGNMTDLALHNTKGPESFWKMTYDSSGFGNVQTITDPVGYTLTYGYDGDVATYVTSVTDNFGVPYYSSATYNVYFGQMETSTDLNGNHQVNVYDDFGRLSIICGPYDSVNSVNGNPPECKDSKNPTLAFNYDVPVLNTSGESAQVVHAGAITKNRAVSIKGGDADTIDTVTFADGMRRIIQTRKEADVALDGEKSKYGVNVSGTIVFDDLGRVIQQYQPGFIEGKNYAYSAVNTVYSTAFEYDTLDRTKKVVAPDGATTTTAYEFGYINNAGNKYAVTKVVDPIGNAMNGLDNKGAKMSFKDVDDRILAVVEYNNGNAITTTYNYDPLGQITHVIDDKKNLTTIEYDDLGHRTAIVNPDAGRTEYEYDPNGNITKKRTANFLTGQAINYVYDYNRLKKIDYPNSTAVEYAYGVMNEAYNTAGRIKSVTDESGREERQYGRLGETIWEKKTVEAKTPAVQKKSFTTEYVFDSFGRMTEMTYPDGEKLHYYYDNGGLLFSAWGGKGGNRYDYITALIYDEFGQRRKIGYGNGVASTYAYDLRTRRLDTLVSSLPSTQGGRTIQQNKYTYDLVGNIYNIHNGIKVATNTALPAGPVDQNFTYDDLYQLKHGDGSYTFGPGKGNNYTNDLLYDSIGNINKKTLVNKIIQPSTTETLPKETNYVLNYQYMTGGSTKPHAVTETDDKKYTYDQAGNMLGWTSKTNGTRRTITWNEENRVKQIDDNGKSTYFLYDDGGERVVKRGEHGESIYVNRFYSVRNGELGTKSVYAGETRVLSKLVKTSNTVASNTTTTTSVPGSQGLNHGRGKKLGIIKRLPDGYTSGVNPPEEKDQFYYHGDHLGSSNMITDSYGAVYQHLEYFPYGETWIEEGGSYGGNTPGYKFTGKELDPETGLYYYGARYYDAVLSRWISADPGLEDFLPTGNKDRDRNLPGFGGVYNSFNLGLYSYGHQNPIKFTDPDGKEPYQGTRDLAGFTFGVGVHGFNMVVTDNPAKYGAAHKSKFQKFTNTNGSFPGVPKGNTFYAAVLSGDRRADTGKLVKSLGQAGDLTAIQEVTGEKKTSWYRSDLDLNLTRLEPGKGKSNFDLEKGMLEAFDQYNDQPNYSYVPSLTSWGKNQTYNSNSFARTLSERGGAINAPTGFFGQPGKDPGTERAIPGNYFGQSLEPAICH